MPPPSAIQGDGSVQQGLSAAYESIAFCKHRRAADKRYSLGDFMRRMRQLIQRAESAYPNDGFFASLSETFRLSSQAKAFYRAYDRALMSLDMESWDVLSGKALAHFRHHRPGQLKQGFFNQLNEAFAYQFLVRRGFSRVTVLREGATTKPDIQYFESGICKHCEVKSIGISEEEITRRGSGNTFDAGRYRELSPGFFAKLEGTMAEAQRQIASQSTTGLIFLVIQFDDFTVTHYDRYHVQLSEFLAEHGAPEVVAKVGLLGGRRIEKSRLCVAVT